MKTYPISGLTCQNCVESVRSKLSVLDADVAVSLSPMHVSINENVAFSALENALAGTKYKFGAVKQKSDYTKLLPLFIIMGMIGLVSLKEAYDFHGWMMSYMAGFFIVFGTFKLFDLSGFVDSFATYDLLAARSRLFAYAYPFIELALGFAYLFHYEMRLTTWVALILVSIGTIGVVQALLRKQTIKCACLGSVFNLPMTYVTLIENTMMIVMCIWMLV
jgi:copper chaperone CopZ